MTDYELALDASRGNREALSELVERLRVPLFTSAYSTLRDYHDAQDAVASTITQVCLHIADIRQPESVRGWISKILRNEVTQILRNRSRQTLPLDEEHARTNGYEMPGSTLRLDVQRAMTQLPRDHAQAMHLHYIAGFPIEQVADRLDRPEGTIKRWLHFGRIELAKEMEGYFAMERPIKVSLVQTDMDQAMIIKLKELLGSAGIDEIRIVNNVEDAVKFDLAGDGSCQEMHISEALQDSKLIILDEWLEGRSAFELYSILKSTPEAEGKGFCLLISGFSDMTARAAWAARFDMLFTKESLNSSFTSCMRTWSGRQVHSS
ncbi:MAG: RNA polymerase sigma factor [Armatimonadota bacterium]